MIPNCPNCDRKFWPHFEYPVRCECGVTVLSDGSTEKRCDPTYRKGHDGTMKRVMQKGKG